MSAEIKWNIPKDKIGSGKLAVVYARFSSHSQGEQSIEGQLSEAYKYATAHGYTIVHEYVDRAKSGRSDNREQFQQMLKDTAKKQFDVIILWKVDRFGRNREEITLNKYKCKKNGVRVEYVAETIPNTPEGVILESVLEGFAEYYSLQLSQNIRRGQAESAEKCQSTGGNRPMGYLTGPDKRFILDPDTAPTVKMIFDMYAAGSTVTEIINHLNGLGLRNRKGKAFTNNSLYAVLKNEKYTGVYLYKDKRIEGGMPRIVDDDTFWKVQEMLKINKRAPAHKWSKAEYLLTDKLFCGKCGSGMIGESGTSKTGAKHNYYSCSKKKRFRECDKKSIRQAVVEELVINATVDLLKDDELLEFLIENTWQYYQAQDESQEELNALHRELEQTEKAISNLITAIEAGILNDATKKRMAELEAQQKDLLAAIADREIAKGFHITREYVDFFFRQLRDRDYTDREVQKQLIATFVNSVFLYDDHLKLNFNFSSDSRIISLSEATAADAGEVFVHCASCSTKMQRAPQKGALCILVTAEVIEPCEFCELAVCNDAICCGRKTSATFSRFCGAKQRLSKPLRGNSTDFAAGERPRFPSPRDTHLLGAKPGFDSRFFALRPPHPSKPAVFPPSPQGEGLGETPHKTDRLPLTLQQKCSTMQKQHTARCGAVGSALALGKEPDRRLRRIQGGRFWRRGRNAAKRTASRRISGTARGRPKHYGQMVA